MHHQWACPPLCRKHQHQQRTHPLLHQALCRPSCMRYVNKRSWLHSCSHQGRAWKLPQSSLLRRVLKNNFSVMSVPLFIPTKAVCISTNVHVTLSICMHVSIVIWLSLILTCCANIWTLTLRSLVSCVPSVGNDSILCALWIYTDVKFTKLPQNISVQCTKEFQRKSSLYNHVRGDHGEGWSCKKCGKHFRFPAGYQYHIKVCRIVKKPTTHAHQHKKWNCCISLSFVILLVYALVTRTWCCLFSVMPRLYSGNIGIVMYYCVFSNHEVLTLGIVVYY